MAPLLTKDGLRLHRRVWSADTPRAVVLLVHGFGEHTGRYEHVAAALNDAGYTLASYDQRGWGRSEGRSAFVRRIDDYTDDLALALAQVRSEHPDLPLFLFGHSMGGLVVTLFAIDHKPEVSGLVLSGSAFESDESPFLQSIGRVIGKWFPKLPTAPLTWHYISRSPEVIAAAEADPMYYKGRIIAATGAAMLDGMDRVQAQMEAITYPFLAFHGGADRVTNPQGSRDLYRRAASADKTLKIYDGLYHETLNEPEQAEVLADFIAWLDARI